MKGHCHKWRVSGRSTSLSPVPQRPSGDGLGGSTSRSSTSSRWRRGWGYPRMSCPVLGSQTGLPAGGRSISMEAASALFYWDLWPAEWTCHCALEEWFSLQVLEWPLELQHCQKANQQGWQRCSVTCCPPRPPRRSTPQCCAGAQVWFPAGCLAHLPEEQQRSAPVHLSVLSSGAELARCLWMENKGKQVRRHGRPLPTHHSLFAWLGWTQFLGLNGPRATAYLKNHKFQLRPSAVLSVQRNLQEIWHLHYTCTCRRCTASAESACNYLNPQKCAATVFLEWSRALWTNREHCLLNRIQSTSYKRGKPLVEGWISNSIFKYCLK